MMKYSQLLLFLFVSPFLSCNESPASDGESPIGANRVIVDQASFDSAWSGLQSQQPDSDPFDLNAIRHEGTRLIIDVSYSGGCRSHDFELVWPEVVTMIYPPRYTVILNHEANDDSCEAYLSEVLEFDLAEYDLGLTSEVIEIMDLTIMNGSNGDETLELNP